MDVAYEIIKDYYYPRKLSADEIKNKFREFVASGETSLLQFLLNGGYGNV